MTRQVDVKAILTHIIRGDGLNKCRICMGDTKEGQVHLEDTVMMDGDKAVTLSEIIEIITGIEVVSDEDLPHGLCSTCALNAINAANFRSLCHQAASQWNITIKLLNSLPSKNKNSLFAILENDQIIIVDNNSIPMSELTTQTVKDCIKTLPTHRCYECHKEFEHPLQLFYHLRGSFYIQACFICGKIMSRAELIVHTANVHKCKVYTCKICASILFSYKQLIAHDTKTHAPRSNMCVDCGRGFLSGHALHAHLPVHGPKKCPFCDKMFRNQPCYLYHVKACCKLDKNRPDTYCANNKLTVVVDNKKSNMKMKVHPSHVSTNKSCICDYCGKTFAGKKFVAAHIQIVHLKNTHGPCLYCGKLLASAHMTEHVKRHLSNHSYTCDNCGIVLKTKLGYIQHKRLHTGEKPYSCKLCGETFSASSRRSEHMRKTHNSEGIVLKHACNICPARFRLPYRLHKHMHVVHKNPIKPLKQFGCADCSDKFDSHRGLLHHIRRKHQLPGLLNKK